MNPFVQELESRQLLSATLTSGDNDATTDLFETLGRQTGVGKCNKRLGLTTIFSK